ncbi:MAG: sulfatase, partial [Planctomycetaceae bacterium]|nr:sulfatase [Planctomycetaceae bacterium]
MKTIYLTSMLWICLFVPSIFADDRPNILWLTCEDTGRHLGCYEFPTAVTPTLDHLAKRGMCYRFAWSNYPVCAPARTTIITGCYPASLGAEQMRSGVPLPDQIKMFPDYLRQNGYYCTNNAKEDYNVFAKDNKNCWDVSNNKAHWKNRTPNAPFFAVFNFTVTHESQIRNKHELQRDPGKVPIPKYHPNVPEIRRDWAQYHDRIAQMDTLCAAKLDELDKAGLAESTIIFFFGDHGSGMPRNKRTPLDCGLGVPFIVYFPPKWKHLAPPDYQNGTKSERLISFVDLAPTVLSLAGIEPPKNMQGIAFAGKFIGKPREFVFGFRGRMDERGDLVRSVSDGRYVYVRNYHPEIIYGAKNNYMFQTRT